MKRFVAARLCHLWLTFVCTVPLFVTTPGKLPTMSVIQAPTFQRGVVYASWWHGEYASGQSDQMLANVLKPLGVNWISVVVTCYQATFANPQIDCKTDSKTPTDADIAHVVSFAHNLGMKVMLKPHIDLFSDAAHWRGDIDFGSNATAWKLWFANYTKFIVHYAMLAQQLGADYLVVGTELRNTTMRADEWRAVIKAVRAVYTGPITYAAHHEEDAHITWWDALDAIGIDAYYPVVAVARPTLEQLKAGWQPVIARLERTAQRWGKPIIFTEIGYQSAAGISQTPWGVGGKKIIDLKEQADCYQAVFDVLQDKDWWQGVFWWVWTTNPKQGGPNDADFTAHDKPAAAILKAHYALG
ncbi:MAG: hypothetical protein IT324_07920 [Anaerolineae bacterium]|nr:hypothetical protein [Anaerolineae bacterium]